MHTADETSKTQELVAEYSRKFQYFLDKASPHILYRWIAFGVSFYLYLMRVYWIGAFFIVTYGNENCIIHPFCPLTFTLLLSSVYY